MAMVLGVIAAGCLALAAGLLVQMHLLREGVDPISDPVSLYGTTSIHRLYRTMVIALGGASVLLAVGLAEETDARNLSWLWIFGGCRIAICAFMMDPHESRASAQGRLHLLLAVAAFTAIAFAGARITWSGAPSSLYPVGRLVVISTLATLVARFSPREVFGLAERMIYLSVLAWLTIIAASLIAGG